MASTKYLRDYVTYIQDTVPVGELKLERASIERAVQEAVAIYSTDEPREVTTDITGDGTYTYTLPTGWVDGFSQVIRLEFPAGSQDPRSDTMKAETGIIYDAGTGTNKLRMRFHTPGTSDTIRLTYTVPHTLARASSTIPDPDFEAVACLSTAKTLRMLAGRFLMQTDPHLRGDNMAFRSRSDQLLSLAKIYDETYRRRLGLPESGPSPASVTFDLDPRPSWGTSQLTHYRR